MRCYFDTSALIKIYHNEKGSNRAIALFEENADNYISQIAFTEFNCTLYRKFRNKEIAEEKDALQSINRFETDMQYENILLIDNTIFGNQEILL